MLCQAGRMTKQRRRWFGNWWWLHREHKRRRAAIRARDGDNCWRCNRPMRFDGPPNCGKAATIEHLLPLALGGTDDLDNLVLCHPGCNRHLGVHPPAHKERMRINRAPG
jgi:hypothetical protein